MHFGGLEMILRSSERSSDHNVTCSTKKGIWSILDRKNKQNSNIIYPIRLQNILNINGRILSLLLDNQLDNRWWINGSSIFLAEPAHASMKGLLTYNEFVGSAHACETELRTLDAR